MSDTSRTEAMLHWCTHSDQSGTSSQENFDVMVHLARTLERELAEARKLLAISTSVLAGDDNTRREIIVADNRAFLRNESGFTPITELVECPACGAVSDAVPGGDQL